MGFSYSFSTYMEVVLLSITSLGLSHRVIHPFATDEWGSMVMIRPMGVQLGQTKGLAGSDGVGES
jgi:hypothetical protein